LDGLEPKNERKGYLYFLKTNEKKNLPAQTVPAPPWFPAPELSLLFGDWEPKSDGNVS
jgi:hypothetical protein